MKSKGQTPEKDYFVYVLCDPRKPGQYTYGTLVFTAQPFYVGKGKGKRPQAHINEAKASAKSNHKLNTIRAILREGMEPEVAFSKYMTEQEALEKEIKLIRTIGRTINGGTLTNATDGGDGIPGYMHSEVSKERMSKSQQKIANTRPDLVQDRVKNLAAFWSDPKKAEATRSSKQYSSETMSKTASKFWDKSDQETIDQRNRKVSESHAKRSVECKHATADKKRRSWASHSTERHEDIQTRRLQSLANRSPEEQARTAALQAEASRKRHEANRANALPDDLVLKIRTMNKTMSAVQIAKALGIPYSRVRWVTTGKFKPEIQP